MYLFLTEITLGTIFSKFAEFSSKGIDTYYAPDSGHVEGERE